MVSLTVSEDRPYMLSRIPVSCTPVAKYPFCGSMIVFFSTLLIADPLQRLDDSDYIRYSDLIQYGGYSKPLGFPTFGPLFSRSFVCPHHTLYDSKRELQSKLLASPFGVLCFGTSYVLIFFLLGFSASTLLYISRDSEVSRK